jgi:hypothetical protein
MLRWRQPDGCWSEGQIALEEALFCLDCELIFAGTARCPRCGDEVVWPLAQWLSRPPAAEPATVGVP